MFRAWMMLSYHFFGMSLVGKGIPREMAANVNLSTIVVSRVISGTKKLE